MSIDLLAAGHPQLVQLTSDSVLKAAWASGEVNCNMPFVLNSSEVITAALPADTLPSKTLVEFPKQGTAKEQGVIHAPMSPLNGGAALTPVWKMLVPELEQVTDGLPSLDVCQPELRAGFHGHDAGGDGRRVPGRDGFSV
jgi:hypothetical protein